MVQNNHLTCSGKIAELLKTQIHYPEEEDPSTTLVLGHLHFSKSLPLLPYVLLIFISICTLCPIFYINTDYIHMIL